jgi:lysozyme
MSRPIPQGAPDFIIGMERCLLRVYDDKRPNRISKPGDVPDGKWTAGVGHTSAGLHPAMTVTREMAALWLMDDLRDAARKIELKIGAERVAELGEHQFIALLSFVFNLGTGNPKKKEWDIWGLLRAGRFAEAGDQFSRFVNWDGKPAAGLVKRRNAEQELWQRDLEIEPVDPPSSVTRAEDTPPTPTVVKPIGKSTVAAAGGAAVVATPLTFEGVGKAVKSVHEQLGSIHGFHITKDMVIGALTLAAVFLVALALLKLLQHMREARA